MDSKTRLTFTVEGSTRIAIVNENKCQPQKCSQECKKNCPVVRMGKLCIQVTKQSKSAFISESLCNGCGICVKVCPFKAVSIVNLPKSLDNQTTHRYSANSFKLHRLPIPRFGRILGLVGANGCGKSTALKILSGKEKPNLGYYDNPPSWIEILQFFRGSELQNYFKKLIQKEMKCVIKPQQIHLLPKILQRRNNVSNIKNINNNNNVELGNENYLSSPLVKEFLPESPDLEIVIKELDLEKILDRPVAVLSGGELQRLAIGLTYLKNADVYMFDEASNFLDLDQRLKVAKLINSLAERYEKYVIVVDHDLSFLDFVADYVSCK